MRLQPFRHQLRDVLDDRPIADLALGAFEHLRAKRTADRHHRRAGGFRLLVARHVEYRWAGWRLPAAWVSGVEDRSGGRVFPTDPRCFSVQDAIKLQHLDVITAGKRQDGHWRSGRRQRRIRKIVARAGDAAVDHLAIRQAHTVMHMDDKVAAPVLSAAT